MDALTSILRDSNYNLTLFTENEIKNLNESIFIKETKGKQTYFVKCIIRNKEIQLKPEEIVRQLYTYKLINYYNYPKDRIKFEHPVHFGR